MPARGRRPRWAAASSAEMNDRQPWLESSMGSPRVSEWPDREKTAAIPKNTPGDDGVSLATYRRPTQSWGSGNQAKQAGRLMPS